MPEKDNKNHHVYYLVYMALASLVIIAIVLIFWQTYLSSYFLPTNSNANINENSTYLQLGYDPLITMVPKDLQSEQSKSETFISSLDPKLGSESAKVIVIFWSSFDNEQAKSVLQNLKSLKNKYDDSDVVLVWKDLVNPENKEAPAVLASLAGYCANDQEKFWEFADLAYNNMSNLAPDNLVKLAEQIGIDQVAFSTCLSAKEGLGKISSNYYYAQNQSITAVPTVYINDQKIDDATNTSQIKDIVNQKLNSYAENK